MLKSQTPFNPKAKIRKIDGKKALFLGLALVALEILLIFSRLAGILVCFIPTYLATTFNASSSSVIAMIGIAFFAIGAFIILLHPPIVLTIALFLIMRYVRSRINSWLSLIVIIGFSIMIAILTVINATSPNFNDGCVLIGSILRENLR